MQIVHHVALSADEVEMRELEGLGVKVQDGFFAFEVTESDPRWGEFRTWIARRRPSDFVYTRFSKGEIAAARWLGLEPDWHHGYPQPNELEFGYLEATYDLTEYCRQCGAGLRQKAPFQMRGEPRWGRRSILQLNWVFDEFFVTPEVWQAVFEPRGIASRTVTNRRGIELRTVVQLVVAEEVGLQTDGLAQETCGACGRIKYLPVTRGPLPPLTSEPTGHMGKTRELFGSGASAFREVLVSQALRRDLRSGGVRGASFTPVAERDAVGP